MDTWAPWHSLIPSPSTTQTLLKKPPSTSGKESEESPIHGFSPHTQKVPENYAYVYVYVYVQA